MHVWTWHGANDAYTTLHPLQDDDLLNGTFTTDGSPKAWAHRPKVKPALERSAKQQRPLGDISFLMGGSVVLNGKAYQALGDFLRPFGQFLDLDLVDESGLGGGHQVLHLFNVTKVVPCIDFGRSDTEGKKVLRPAFDPSAVPSGVQVFKDPLRKKMDIYLTAAAHAALTQLISGAALTGSSLVQVA